MTRVFHLNTSSVPSQILSAKSIAALTMLHATQLADTLHLAARYWDPTNKGRRVAMLK